MTPADLWSWVGLLDPRLSADGRMAWVAVRLEPGADAPIPRVEVRSAAGTVALAFDDGRGCSSPRWSPDGRALAALAAGAPDRTGGLAPQVWLLADGVEPRQLTDVPAGVRDLAWSPDGSRLCVVAVDGPPIPRPSDPVEVRRAPKVVRGLRTKLDGVGWTNESRNHLLLVDVTDGSASTLTSGDWDDAEPVWSPDGRTVAFVSDRRPERVDARYRGDLWLVSADGQGDPERVTGSTGLVVSPTWSADGRLAHLGCDAGDAFWTAELEVRVGDAAWAGGVHRLRGPEGRVLAWAPDGTLLVTAAVQGSCHLVRVTDRATSTVLGGEVRVGGFDVGADGTVLAVTASVVQPPRIVAVHPDGTEEVVADPNAGLAAKAAAGLAEVRRLDTTAPDGTTTATFLLVPSAAGPHRLALDLHGGPQGWHPAASSAEWVQHHALLAAGFVVVLPNPRGSSGFGADLMASCVGDWGPGPMSDVLAAVDAVVGGALGDVPIDPADPVIGGYSYGGYLATFVTAHDHRFRRSYVGAPISDPWSAMGSGDIHGFIVHSIGAGERPWEAPDRWVEQSPAQHAHRCTTPTLLTHHEGDLRCPVGQSELLFSVLRQAGCEVELVRYPGGFHGTSAPFHLVDRLERVLGWLTA